MPPAASPVHRFDGSRVIVTGGARGIGAGIVRRFLSESATVAVLDRLPCDGLGVAAAIAVDLADADATRAATERAIEVLDGVDILVNNAGIFRTAPLLDIDPAEWDLLFAVNTRAMLVTIQAAARAMLAAGAGGRIVNTASMGGKVGAAGQAHYAASKAAVISLTQVAAAELGCGDITVNAVCPGYVLTEMGADTRTEAQVAEWSARSPLGRLGTPDDVAEVVTFLASPGGGYCTGQAFNVTGGMIVH